MARSKNFKIKKKWVFLDKDIKAFKVTKISPILAKILAIRGLKNEKEAREFLEPDYQKLSDPYSARYVRGSSRDCEER